MRRVIVRLIVFITAIAVLGFLGIIMAFALATLFHH